MGCDIHAHIEIKINGKWEHWTAPKINRWYQLFGRLAGVRCPEEPHPPVRQFPIDVTVPTMYDYRKTYGHTASWITWQELNEIQKWVEIHEDYKRGHGWHSVIGYLCGNSYRPQGDITDIRMVFWFDN